MLVAALVLPGCAEEAVVEEEEEVVEEEVVEEEVVEEEVVEEEVVEPPVGEPQYGGTLTAFPGWWTEVDFWPLTGSVYNTSPFITHWVTEMPFTGDIEKYGPRGTGEYSFTLSEYVRPEWQRPLLVESWEYFPDKVVWHVRQGIYFQGLNQGQRIIEDRLLTAADIVATVNHWVGNSNQREGSSMAQWVGEAYTTDEYTLVIPFTDPALGKDWQLNLGVKMVIGPSELLGTEDYSELVGTGSFMLEEMVIGSHLTFVPNPLYWDVTTIDGVEYKIPFVDEMVTPFIPDAATRAAAWRSGKVDVPSHYVGAGGPRSVEEIRQTIPEMMITVSVVAGGPTLVFRLDEPPFDNKDVRRALAIGTNREVWHESAFGTVYPTHWWPFHWEHPFYTPPEEEPANIAVLFDYDPDEAIRLLEEAGYPFGTLKADLHVPYPSGPDVDEAALLVSEWAKIGVELELKPQETTAWVAMMEEDTWSGLQFNDIAISYFPKDTLWEWGAVPQLAGEYWIPNPFNWQNAEYYELAKVWIDEEDEAEIERMSKELASIMLDEAVYIAIRPRIQFNGYWPWVRNYYGEQNTGHTRQLGALAYVWIDEDLKAELGY